MFKLICSCLQPFATIMNLPTGFALILIVIKVLFFVFNSKRMRVRVIVQHVIHVDIACVQLVYLSGAIGFPYIVCALPIVIQSLIVCGGLCMCK